MKNQTEYRKNKEIKNKWHKKNIIHPLKRPHNKIKEITENLI